MEERPEGALALVILLDQFPRNMFRGSAPAFATDPLARAAANQALGRGVDRVTDEMMRPVFYLPFMHSELLADQDRSEEAPRAALALAYRRDERSPAFKNALRAVRLAKLACA